MQEIASLKRQFAELLSDIGFIKEGLRARIIERASSKGTDGVLEATGREVTQIKNKFSSAGSGLFVLLIDVDI